MTASETAPAPPPRPEPSPLRPPGDARATSSAGAPDPAVGPRRLLIALVLLGLGLLVGGLTPLLGGGENVVAARMGIAVLLITIGLVALARRPSLAAAGLGVVLGLLLHANPFYGDRSTQWPWELWVSSQALDHQVDIALWVVAALLALVRAYLGRGLGLVLGAVLLALLAVVRSHAQGGGVPLLRNEEHLDLSWTLTIAALGTSALLFARGSSAGRRSARALAVLGTALAATIYLAWFPVSVGGSMAQHYYWRAGQAWDVLVTSVEASPHVREGVLKDVLGRIAPFWCLVAALPALLFAALLPRPSRLSRLLGVIALSLMALRWLVPALSEFYFQREFLGIRGPSLVCAIVGDALTGAGLAAWLLLSSCASLALASGASRAEAPALGGGAAPRPVSRLPYAVACALLLVALYSAFNPETGTVAMAWPWDLAWDPFWSPPTAGCVLGGVSFLALAVALLCRPGPVRAGLALGGLLVGIAALAGPDPKAYLYGVRPLVPPMLLAIAVGGAAAVRGGRGGTFPKALVWAAALLLLAVLFYPLPLVGRGGTDPYGYRSTIGGIVLALRQSHTPAWDFLTSTYSPGLVILSLATMGLAIVAARGPGRRPVALWVLFAVTLAYPSLHTAWAIASEPLSRVGGPVEEFVRRVRQDLSVYYLPHAIGIAAVVADFLTGPPSGAPVPPLPPVSPASDPWGRAPA